MQVTIEFSTKMFSRVLHDGATPYDWEAVIECDTEPAMGSCWDGETFIAPPPPPEPTNAPVLPKAVSPVEFKLLFTAPERIAIKTSVDPVIQDFFEIVNDPRLTHVNLSLQSTQDALGYLALQGVIAESRIAEILQGEIL